MSRIISSLKRGSDIHSSQLYFNFFCGVGAPSKYFIHNISLETCKVLKFYDALCFELLPLKLQLPDKYWTRKLRRILIQKQPSLSFIPEKLQEFNFVHNKKKRKYNITLSHYIYKNIAKIKYFSMTKSGIVHFRSIICSQFKARLMSFIAIRADMSKQKSSHR